jgi:hypothetical protein
MSAMSAKRIATHNQPSGTAETTEDQGSGGKPHPNLNSQMGKRPFSRPYNRGVNVSNKLQYK